MRRDIISDANDGGALLFGESKYTLDDFEKLDAVFCKWRQVEYEHSAQSDGMLFVT